MSEQNKFAKLEYDGKVYTLPVIIGTENEAAIDISKLRDMTGLITLDPGYKNTGSTQSAITFLDGETGILRYRGYDIEELAEHASFMEVACLLLFGDLPTQSQLTRFEKDVAEHSLLHEDMRKFFDALPSTTHPMGVIAAMTSALTSFYPRSLDPYRPPHEVYRTMVRSMAKLPTIAAWAYKASKGHPFNYPDNTVDYCSRFLKMMFAMPTSPYEIDPVLVGALNKLLILHADHEQNCSTSTVRIVGSSLASLYSAIAAAINALGGPLHGGANQEVLVMLRKIKESGVSTKTFIDKVKSGDKSARLMGFGHRVYKNFDPRAKIIKKACDDVLNKLGINDPLLGIAKELEEAALNDDYFVSRKLYPNVDFYSGIIYQAMNIPEEMFTVMFALGRLPGWIAQWKEMLDMKQAIGRPRQVYIGATQRAFVPMDKRVDTK
ncbi:MAG: citrate synthase [Cytophagales bacterium]|nr:MAG: citrate synthase [Cytophagales bacterium]TAF60980.1 MAG: citrate synthase [Cytophagales bacterium]